VVVLFVVCEGGICLSNFSSTNSHSTVVNFIDISIAYMAYIEKGLDRIVLH